MYTHYGLFQAVHGSDPRTVRVCVQVCRGLSCHQGEEDVYQYIFTFNLPRLDILDIHPDGLSEF